MCSVSWSRAGGRLVVVMNRDERRDRAPAGPPRRWDGAAGGFIAPVDPEGGGSWVAARPGGLVIALLNHQEAQGLGRARRGSTPVGPQRISRGLLVTTLAAEADLPDAARLRAAGLAAYAPFRLFVAGPAERPRVFTWNGATLTARWLDPRRGFLTSSSWNARAVVAARHATFRAFARDHRQPSPAELLAFHDQARHPRGTPWAICMAREDACTVSTTIVEAGPEGVSMGYRTR